MFLKINLGKKIKKVMYPKDIDSYQKFKNFVSDVLKRPHDTFSVYFIDNEYEKFKLDDDHDFEYFNEYSSTQKSKEIYVQIDDSDFLEMSFQQINEVNQEKENLEIQKIKELSTKCEEQEIIINDLNVEKQNLQEKIQNLEENKQKIIEELKEINLTKIKELEEINQKKIEEQEKNNEQKIQQLELHYTQKLSQSDSQTQQKETIIQEITEKLNSLNTLVDQKNNEIKILNEQCNELEEKLAEEKTVQQKMSKLFEQTKAKMKLDQETSSFEISEYKKMIEQQQQENAYLEEQQCELKEFIDQIELQKQNLTKSLEESKQMLSEKDQINNTNESYIENQLTQIEDQKQKLKEKDDQIKKLELEIEKVIQDKQKDIENQKQYIQYQDEQIKLLEKKVDYVNKNQLNESQLLPEKKEQTICNMLEESNISMFDQNYVQKQEVNKLNESFQQMQDQLSFFMTQMQQGDIKKQKLNSSVINSGINCSECSKESFTGKRYLCMYCEDFNICEECEHKNNHPHLMIRIHGNENDILLEYVIKKIKNFQDKKKNKKNKKDKKCKKNKNKEEQEIESKSKLIEFVYGQSQNEAQATIRKQFINKHIDCGLEEFHKMIVDHAKIFEQFN